MTPSLWILLYLTLLVTFTVMAPKQDGRFDPFSAQMLFNVPTAFYALGAAINYHWLGMELWRYGYLTTIQHIETCLPFAVVALACFNLAYLLSPLRRLGERLPALRTGRVHEQALGHWGVGAVFVAGTVTVLGFSYFGLGDVFGSPYGTLAMASQSLIHASMFTEAGATLAAAYVYKHGRWASPFGVLVGGAVVAYLLFVALLGKRAGLLYVLLSLLVLRHLFRKRVGFTMLAASGAALAALFIFIELGRASPVRTPTSMVDHFWYMARESLEFAEWRDWPARILSQGDNLGTFGVVMERIPDSLGFQYGWTYLEAVLRLIPGFLWRGIFSEGLTSLVGEHLAFFYLAEAYLNFGLVGIFVVPAVFGTFLRVVDDWRRHHRDSFLVGVIFAVEAGSIAYLSRLDLGNVLKDLVYRPVFLLALYLLTAKLARQPSRTVTPATLKTPAGSRVA